MAIFGYTFASATTLSKCLVLGNSLCQVAINLRKRHPKMNTRSLIYWEMILIFLPAQLGGNTVGAIVAKVLPDSAIYIIALIVLWVAIIKSGIEGRHRYAKESKAKQPLSLSSIGVVPAQVTSGAVRSSR
jgi:uncharacterized membrane protein YfcA